MSNKRKNVPRASIQVGVLDDEDYIALTQDTEGLAAFGFFVSVIVLARDMEMNPVPVFAVKRRLGLTETEIKNYSKRIQGACEFNQNEWWLDYSEGEHVYVRSYSQWNKKEARGGARKGAGRKSKKNQNEIKGISESGPSVTVTVTSLPKGKETCSFFEQFWADYPRKVGRKGAERKFAAAVKDGVDPERILVSLRSHVRQWATEGTDIKYIPHPATWLNQGRWDDAAGNVVPQPTPDQVERLRRIPENELTPEQKKQLGWRFSPGSGWQRPAV